MLSDLRGRFAGSVQSAAHHRRLGSARTVGAASAGVRRRLAAVLQEEGMISDERPFLWKENPPSGTNIIGAEH